MDTVTERMLVVKGAEASLYRASWQGKDAIMKIRIPKAYRPPELDRQIRSYRTVHEPQLMHEAKEAGVPTPLIYMVNVPEAAIVMEYVEGKQVKRVLSGAPTDKRQEMCRQIGGLIAKLHTHGLIHGDLTTSNMILTPQRKIVLVDFGLGEKNSEVEVQGVDLHLMKRALQSTHYQHWEDCFKEVLSGYQCAVGTEQTEKVYEKIREIERRGRYVEERKQ
jgi:TP53 regulating kinase-like protein